jgi:hypothetical protein
VTGRDDSMTDERLDSLENWREEVDRKWSEAFPNGDHVGHCRYHQLMIDDIEARRSLRKAVMEKTISGLVWSLVVGMAFAVWTWLKKQVNEP